MTVPMKEIPSTSGTDIKDFIVQFVVNCCWAWRAERMYPQPLGVVMVISGVRPSVNLRWRIRNWIRARTEIEPAVPSELPKKKGTELREEETAPLRTWLP